MSDATKEQAWFELSQFRKRVMDSQAWIPLHAVESAEESGQYGHVGYRKDFFGCGTVALPVEHREAMHKVGWSDLGIGRTYRGYSEDGIYVPADEFRPWNLEGVIGHFFVMLQNRSDQNDRDWIVSPDLLLTLGLYQEGDVWVCPAEGYVEVIKIHRNAKGEKNKLEIRAEFLKDYLAARGWGMWMTWYRERSETQADVSHFTWPELKASELGDHIRWEGRVIELHEGGHFFGSEAAVFHVTRTDVDLDEDIPQIEVPTTEAGTASRTMTRKFDGKKVFHVIGELWREEWISPAPRSLRVLDDEPENKPTFVLDASGTRKDKAGLSDEGRWLWFKPEVVKALLGYRAGTLSWHTRRTGGVGADLAGEVYFGINDLGLVNVYAKDIGMLPYWQQQIWAGFNVGPDGKVSAELLKAQAVGKPADTQAPEAYLARELDRLDRVILSEFGVKAFRTHHDTARIIDKCHRFRATSPDGLLELAKDLARLTADAIDASAIHPKLNLQKGEKPGGLKCLEKLVELKGGKEAARKITAPLFGTYDLRLADAHLPKSDLEQALKNAGVESNKPTVIQGEQMLHHVVASLATIADVLKGD